MNVIYASWDHHDDIDKRLPYNAAVVDQPIAALIKDLKRRGMLEDTMVVWGSELGTPLGQGDGSKSSGRDHHPSPSMLMAGAASKVASSAEESDEFGWGVEEKPVHINTTSMPPCLEHEQLTYRWGLISAADVGGEVIKDWLA